MIIRLLLLLTLLCATTNLIAQDMQKGFDHLEKGEYIKAEQFFENILDKHPDNKTARLCYGRAIGLKGQTQQAKKLFLKLLKDFPNDHEVKLNYGESLLWNKNFKEAKRHFQNLIKENSNSFSAMLSYANTLSNLKEYENAIYYINKALQIKPDNENALNSKRYIYLGYAYKMQQAQKYEKAEKLLKKNLAFFENDPSSLKNLANLYLIMEKLEAASSTYELLAEQEDQRIIALNGLALLEHKNRNNKDALEKAIKALGLLKEATKEKVVIKTKERYVQALIWNKKFKKAETKIRSLLDEQPEKSWIIALRATLYTYKREFNKSLSAYNKILRIDSTSFDGNLGKANALKALRRYDEAYASAKKTLKFYDGQKDAKNFIEKLDRKFTPFVHSKALYSFDNGDNTAYASQNHIKFPFSTKFQAFANFNYRETSNSATNEEAIANNLSLGLDYLIFPQIKLNTYAGLTSVATENNEFSNFVTDISFNIRSLKRQVLDVGYKRRTESFNAALLEQELIQNSYYLNHNLSTNFRLGWFTQYIYTTQSDENSRSLLFTSLYYNITDAPKLKVGVNYQNIQFEDQRPMVYFSPERFNVVEVFADLIKKDKGNFSYSLNAATGLQYIENNEAQNTFRVKTKMGYTFKDRLQATLYAQYSDIASTTVAGFNYTELGFKLQWHLFKKPIFRK